MTQRKRTRITNLNVCQQGPNIHQRRPTTANEGEHSPMKANKGPMYANEGPMYANDGPQQPARANKIQHRPTGPNICGQRGQQRPNVGQRGRNICFIRQGLYIFFSNTVVVIVIVYLLIIKNRSELVNDQFRLKPVITGLLTENNRIKPIVTGYGWSGQVF
jgi:hypothetical protein